MKGKAIVLLALLLVAVVATSCQPATSTLDSPSKSRLSPLQKDILEDQFYRYFGQRAAFTTVSDAAQAFSFTYSVEAGAILDGLRALGIDPYPTREYDRYRQHDIRLLSSADGDTVTAMAIELRIDIRMLNELLDEERAKRNRLLR